MIRVLSRLPERRMLGLEGIISFWFYYSAGSDTHRSRDVARLVTQPLWPSRVPLRINCSVMMGQQLVQKSAESKG
jgi:hypothetical protein